MSSESPAAATPRPRQQAGLACDECRRRKLRCDRGQPQCGVCRDSSVTCITTTTRQPRGPRRGHLKALQSRIVALERRISNDATTEDLCDDEFMSFPDDDTTFASQDHQSFTDFLALNAQVNAQPEAAASGSSNDSAENLVTPASTVSLGMSAQAPIMVLSPVDCISSEMRSDLDHLYFDRVHSFCPILSKRNYFSRARRPRGGSEVDAFSCLQHAMWTLAVSTSSQFQYIQDDLYAYTRLMIDNLELESLQADCIQIEQVQAWALLAIYEFMRVGYRRGWMSAGKCFRFAVLIKLHNVDGRDGIAATSLEPLTFAEIEERRRTFWMAYTIDRIISLLDHLPLTFDQQVILTRLPAPEKEFQSDQPVVMEFLSDLQHDKQPKATSAFTESIRLVTICGQSLSHQQQGTVEHTHGWLSLDFWERQNRLDAHLTQSIEGMGINDPATLVYLDPMPHFTALAAQAAVLMLFKASQTAPWGPEDYQEVASEYERRALAAAQTMVTLSKALIELSYFKIHPFTPVLLYFCGDFLSANSHLDPTFEMQASLQHVLRGLTHVNKIAMDCLNRLQLLTWSSEVGMLM